MSEITTAKGLPAAFKLTGFASAALTITLIYYNQPNWLLAVVVLGFVIGYGLWINSRQELNTQNDADSIYYLGFGLTIISLAVSSYVHFGSSGEFKLENLKSVFSQFAIGLIATCFGLIGRLIVVAKLDDTVSNETDDAQKRRELVASLGELRLEVVGFADQLRQLNQDLRQQQLELHSHTVEALREAHQVAIKENSRSISMAHDQIAQATQASISQVSQMVGTLTQQQLNLQAQAYAGLAELSEKTHAQISALDFANISQKTNQAVNQLAHSCENFSTQTGIAQQSMQQSSTHLASFSGKVGQDLAAISERFDLITQSTEQHNLKIQHSTQVLTETTTQLIQTGIRSNQVLAAITQQYDGYQKSHEKYLKGCDDILNQAVSTSQQVVQSIANVDRSVSSVETALIVVAKKSTEMAQKFRDSAPAKR